MSVNEVRVVQESEFVGDEAVYDLLIKSPYVLYEGDLVYLKIPPEASRTLAYSFRTCEGSPLQSYINVKTEAEADDGQSNLECKL